MPYLRCLVKALKSMVFFKGKEYVWFFKPFNKQHLTQSFKYNGSTLSKDGSTTTQIKTRFGLALSATKTPDTPHIC